MLLLEIFLMQLENILQKKVIIHQKNFVDMVLEDHYMKILMFLMKEKKVVVLKSKME